MPEPSIPTAGEDGFPCPHGGAAVPAGAAACPACGSDAETGWAEDADLTGALGTGGWAEDDEFDYDAYVEREFGGKPTTILGLPAGVFVLLALAAAAVILLVALLAR